MKYTIKIFCPLLLMIISFGSSASTLKVGETKNWFFDAQLVTSEVTGNSYLFAGVSIARRFYQRWFVGVSTLANMTEKQVSNIDGNVYPSAQLSLIAGYGNRLYKNVHYQMSIGWGGGIGEFTQVDGDSVGICQCSYEALQITGELSYLLSSSNSVALQLKHMGFDSGDIEASSTGVGAAYRYSW